MAIAQEYAYFRPTKLAEAVALKAKYGKDCQPLAGGTDLIVNLHDEMVKPKAVIDLKGIPELRTLKLKGDTLWIGALVTFTELIESKMIKEKFPLFWEAAESVACRTIRNRATMVGNLTSCVPCMDSAPGLVLHGATAIAHGKKGEREIPIADLFLGPRKTSLTADELLVGLAVPLIKEPHGTSYVKLKRYRGEDLAQASVSLIVTKAKEYRVAFGSVGPVPLRSTKIEKMLNGNKLSKELLAKVSNAVKKEIAPITDLRATKEYRTHMCEVMLVRGLQAAANRAAGKGPKVGTELI